MQTCAQISNLVLLEDQSVQLRQTAKTCVVAPTMLLQSPCVDSNLSQHACVRDWVNKSKWFGVDALHCMLSSVKGEVQNVLI